MRKKLAYLLMLICSVSMFIACSDNDEPNIPIERELAGTYKGTLDIDMNGTNLAVGLPKNISIIKAGTSSINLELKDFSFGTFNLGTIIIQDCAMDKYRDHYTFAGKQTLTFAAPIGECPIVVNGTIVGREVIANLDITVPTLNQTVKVVYKGLKLQGNESSEAKITSFAIDSEVLTEQPSIDQVSGNITFKVNEAATDEQLKLTPVFAISPKAIVYPASGVAQDFSKNKSIVYTVVAEDGTTKAYTVSIAGSQNILKYSFEEWDNSEGYDAPLPLNQLGSSAAGAVFLGLFGETRMPVYKTEDSKEGNYAIKLVTLDTSALSALYAPLVPAITSGSLFTGKFDLDYLMDGKLLCTRFGIVYDKKPVRFKGWYKYTPGEKFLDGTDGKNPIVVPNKKDECSITAVLYKIENDDDVLTGEDINNAPNRIAVATLKDGTEKKDYTYFDLEFEFLPGKTYELGAKYKLAIVCSSSKEGDFFKGAGDSTLFLDELEIIGE